MIQTVKEIILDFQQTRPFTGVPRRIRMKPVQGKALVCMGVRRCGKTTCLFQIMEHLIDAGVSRENLLYLNFFDDRLHSLRHDTLGVITEAYFSVYPEKKNVEKIHLFLDEIQAIQGWEPFVDRLIRTEKCDIYITGSSARMLSREIATQMRGRAISWELFPFSFQEFLDLKNIDGTGPLSSKKRLTIQKAFDDYWHTGGFPEVISQERLLRLKIHQEYFNAMLFRDLVERHDISHPRAVTDLAHWLVDNIASLYSINNLTGYLKTLGHKVPKSAVADYLEWFEDAYILFTVRIFDASVARANTNPKKIYCIDHALVTSVASGILLNTGHLLENMVFMALRRITADIYYFKTRTGREVDFIIKKPDRSFMLIQVCETMVDEKTRIRETTALWEAMKQLNMDTGYIVTHHEEEIIRNDAGEIHILPMWRFLLLVSE